jgi:hypothetical protein
VLPVLPVVVPVLLEALSGLEDARLNYVEQVGRAYFDGHVIHLCMRYDHQAQWQGEGGS